MQIRNTQTSVFQQVKNGLNANFAKLVLAQRQISSGKRILNPSDDPVGASLAITIRGRQADVQRALETIGAVRPGLQTAANALEDASGLLAQARALLVQGLSGTLQPADRRTLATEVEELRDRMLELANSKAGAGFVFAGSEGGTQPFVERTVDGRRVVVYQGNGDVVQAAIGQGVEIGTNVPGSQAFGGLEHLGAAIAGSTGAALGSSASQGTGFAKLTIRHDATTGALPAGVAFVNAGTSDTFVGDRTLVIDGTAGTVQLGDGEPVAIPQAGDADLADFVVRDASGAEVHLDFTGHAGASGTSTITGAASASIDGGATFHALDLGSADVRLIDEASGTVLHVDATAIRRTGTDLVTFRGAVDVFAVLDGIVEDLRNTDGLDTPELGVRLQQRLGELDRRHEGVLESLGTLGARLARLEGSESRLGDVGLYLESRRSDVEDADITDLVLELTQSRQSLELAQATGSRLIQLNLLSFLG
jgi:flagellar hook-associated protein 3 FlgL